jgi:hypothetical protein
MILLLSACATTETAAARSGSGSSFSERLVGGWKGSLKYKDYQEPNREVRLPTVLKATSTSTTNGVVLDYVYDEASGKTVHSTSIFALDDAGRELRWGSRQDAPEKRPLYAVQSLDCRESDVTCRLIVETEGEDDDKPATIRETVIVGGVLLLIIREVRFAGEQDFIQRHAYSLVRRP